MKTIVITDSGLGGLSIVAALYKKLKRSIGDQSLNLVYVNALPQSGKGYNKMPDTASKVTVFNRVLHGIYNNFSPDLIAIACNTLSVIADQTDFVSRHKDKTLGIVNLGIDSLIDHLKEKVSFYVIIFGSETTIEMDRHRQLMIHAGIPGDRIIPQVCSGLASAIELDHKGSEVNSIIERSVNQALQKCERKINTVFAYLACTHYGYVKTLFEKSIKSKGFTNSEAFNPNQSMVNRISQILDLTSFSPPVGKSTIRISVVSRCKILESEIISISSLLSDFSTYTAQKLINYSILPDLF